MVDAIQLASSGVPGNCPGRVGSFFLLLHFLELKAPLRLLKREQLSQCGCDCIQALYWIEGCGSSTPAEARKLVSNVLKSYEPWNCLSCILLVIWNILPMVVPICRTGADSAVSLKQGIVH